MKTVYDMDEVADLWVHQKLDSAQYRRKFMFMGSTIYSYGPHYPISSIIEYKGKTAFVVNSRKSSMTTEKHKWIVTSHIPSTATVFHVSQCNTPGVAKNGVPCGYKVAMKFIAEKLNKINELLKKQRRARTNDYRQAIICEIAEIYKWIDFWRLHKRCRWGNKMRSGVLGYWKETNAEHISIHLKQYISETASQICLFSLLCELGILQSSTFTVKQVDALLERTSQKDYPDMVSAMAKRADDRALRAIKRQQKKRISSDISELEKWHDGRVTRWNPGLDFTDKFHWTTALRVEGDYIFTSKGIQISFDEGKKLWTLINTCEHGKSFKPCNVSDLSGSKWSVDKYENHILTAGCHEIPFSECERIAKQMGWQ